MPSIHTDQAFQVAVRKGAAVGRDRADWDTLASYSKRELVEAALHLAALAPDEGYDEAIQSEGAFKRLVKELNTLRDSGLI